MKQAGIFFVSPINRRNSNERKDSYDRVIPIFLKTKFEKWQFGFRAIIERVLKQLRSDGLAQP